MEPLFFFHWRFLRLAVRWNRNEKDFKSTSTYRKRTKRNLIMKCVLLIMENGSSDWFLFFLS